jgi:hypothetical protein
MSEPNEERVHYRDLIPYQIPDSLDDLRGPQDGVITLPVHVNAGPDRRVDLSTASGRYKAVTSLLEEGTVADQVALLNADLVRRVWPELRLPPRCRELWETRFPELTELRR